MLAFPTAMGHGKDSAGGRGGTAYYVTNLNDDGDGSLRDACEGTGARYVIFQVAGIIQLTSGDITVTNPYLTIAGQTAPGDGVCLAGAGLVIRTNNVIVRGLRSRPGYDAGSLAHAIALANPAADVILDHCSVSWTQDALIQTDGVVDSVTIQNCLIGEVLADHAVSLGAGTKNGTMTHLTNSSFLRNYIANSQHRNPKVIYQTESFNNLVYNWQNIAVDCQLRAQMDMAGNHYKAGPVTTGVNMTVIVASQTAFMRIYVNDNIAPELPTGVGNAWNIVDSAESPYRSATRLNPSEYNPFGAGQTWDWVHANAGAFPRDCVDTRLLNDSIDDTGTIITHEDDVGGWCTYSGTTRTQAQWESYVALFGGDVEAAMNSFYGETSPGAAAQNFNVDLTFLYGTTEEIFQGQITPAFESGYTDWNRRAITLPTVSKSIENWTGGFQSSEIFFDLADTDGSVYGSLYKGTSKPFGKPVAVYAKVIDNPEYWAPAFTGNISRVERSRGLTGLAVQDGFKNVLNTFFVPDYLGIATNVEGTLYGTVKDVIGSNVYIDDKGDKQLITKKRKDSPGWFSSLVGAVVGAAAGAISGGAALGPILLGAAGGGLSGLGKGGGGGQTSYWKVTDYDLIKEDVVFGGQSVKFYSGTVDGRANGTAGALYNTPALRLRGGTFQFGLYGTLELDELEHGVKKGDYMYVELPIYYSGSPDTILVDMLTGSNTAKKYSFPTDFSSDWFDQTNSLRHIEAQGLVSNLDRGGLADVIDTLSREFGFTFYIDETNRFAVRSLRVRDINSTTIIGTLREGYNVLGDGIKTVENVDESYTNLILRYKDTFIGNIYEQKIEMTSQAGTENWNNIRTLEISSEWMHDSMTGEYIASRLVRRYFTIPRRMTAQISLYSVPMLLGDLIVATGWALGSNTVFESLSYSKDFTQSIADIEAEDASYLYKERGYFLLGSVGTFSASSKSGFATLRLFATTLPGDLSPIGSYGTNGGTIGHLDTVFYATMLGTAPLSRIVPVGGLMRMGTRTDEVMKVTNVALHYTGGGVAVMEYSVNRAHMGIGFRYWPNEPVVPLAEIYATRFNIGTQFGRTFNWY